MKFLAKVIWLGLVAACWVQQWTPAPVRCETYRGVTACWEVVKAEPVSTFLGITALFGLSTTTAAIVGGAIVSFGLNIGIGLLQNVLRPKPKLGAELGNRLVTVRQAISYRRWVAGTVGKLAGIITFFHQAQVGGAHYDYVVVTLSGRRLKSIGNLYFDDELVPLDVNGDATGKYAGLVKVEKKLGGDDQAALSLFTAEVGSKWTANHRQRSCAHAGLRLKFDQDKLPFLPNIRFDVEGPEVYDPRTGTLVATANAALQYADFLTDIVLGPGYSRLAGFSGATLTHSGLTTFDVAKVGDGDVTVAAWGVDAATAGAVLKVDLGASGAQEFNWCRVFTLAGGGTAQWKVQWSDDDSVWNEAQENILLTDVAGWKYVRLAGNGAHRWWRLRLENTPGAGPEFSELEFYESEVNRAQLIAAANICDQDVNLLAGGTEKRYTINGSFTMDADPAEIIPGMRAAMAGWDAETGSGWMIYPGAFTAPTVTLTKADLREADEPILIRAARAKPELFNTVQGVFAGPVTDWQPAGAPVVPKATSSAAVYVSQDSGERLVREVQLPFTTSAARAQRILQAALEDNRRQIGVSWRGKWSAWRVEGGQTVGITLPEAGWTNKSFLVLKSNLVQEEGQGAEGEPPNPGLILGVDLELEEIDGGVFAWNAASDEQPFTAPPTIAAPPVPLAPTLFPAGDPTVRPRLRGDLEVDGRGGDLLTFTQHLGATGLLADADKIAADGVSFVRVNPDQRTGGGRGFSALNSLNNLITGTANKTVAQIEDAQVRATTAIDVGNVVVAAGLDFTRGYTNKHLGNVPDDTQRKARTAAHSSYRPLGNYLTASDVGASATISLAAGTNRVAGVDVAVNSGSITGVGFDVLRFVRYDDASFAGGAVTYAVETVKEDALNGSGRFFWGSIRTPKDGAPDTIGNNDGGSGAQIGMLSVLRPTEDAVVQNGGFNSPLNAYDGDLLTSASQQSPAAGGSAIHVWRKFSGSIFNTPAKLKVHSSVQVNAGAGIAASVEYSINSGSTWTTIFTSANRAATTDTVTLPAGTNPHRVHVRGTISQEDAVPNISTLFVTETWIEAEF